MPLNLPDKLPAIELLKEENIFVIDTSRATQQDIRPLRIVILNLMPLKITTETDLVRLLSNTPLQVEISFMKIKSHTSKTDFGSIDPLHYSLKYEPTQMADNVDLKAVPSQVDCPIPILNARRHKMIQ